MRYCAETVQQGADSNVRTIHEVRPLARPDVAVAGAVLGRAFVDSPGYRALLSHLDGARRVMALERVKRGFVEAAVRFQEADGIWVNGELVGASLVQAPGQYPTSLRAEAWQSTGCARTGLRGIANFIRIRSYIAKRHIREPHYYLFVLGIEPKFQGRGLGRALLAKLHERVDANPVASYLETDTERNVRLYSSVGYEVLTDERVPGFSDFRYWTMRRPVTATRSRV
jgi:ribosomal protein S18 acetylase RimI-like enzyme